MSVQLRILGSPHLDAPDGGQRDALVRQSKRMALLVYLAAAQPRGYQRRDTLLALFWPELDASHARSALSQALYVLRQSLGERAILTRGDGEVAVDPDHVWCDARELEAKLDAGQAEDALRLYQGDLLQGFYVSDAPGFEQWVESERARLRQRASEGAWAVAEEKAAKGDAVEATRWARRATELAPDDEAGVRRLMNFLRGVGNRSAALRAYEAFAWQLGRDYELEPSAETQAMAIAIREEGRHPASVRMVKLSSIPAILVAVRRVQPIGAIAIVLLLFGGLAAARVLRGDADSPPAPVRFALSFPDPPIAAGVAGSTIAMSPDGELLAFLATNARGRALMLRPLEQLDAREMPHTSGAYLPFFSPDGTRLGFVADGEIRTVPVAGGPAMTVCPLGETVFGASWDATDSIVFATAAGVWRVAASGGTPRLLAAPDTARGETYRWPAVLPSAQNVIVTRVDRSGFQLVAISVDDGAVRPLGVAGTNAHHVASHTLVFARHDGVLLAAPFDERRLAITGASVAIAEGIIVGLHGAAKLGVSSGAALAYLPEQFDSRALVSVDRVGTMTPLPVPEQRYHSVKYSRDGTRLAVSVITPTGQGQDIWVLNLTSATSSRVTFDKTSVNPAWSPDDRRVVYATSAGGRESGFSIRSVAWEGSDSALTILAAEHGQLPLEYASDQALLVQRSDARTRKDIWVLGAGTGAGTLEPWLRTPSEERAAVVSPDGRWVAYTSDESGRDEVYVQSFPRRGAPLRVSANGGREPRWAMSRRELFYRGEGKLFAVALEMDPEPVVVARNRLFDDAPFVAIGDASAYDVHPDGQRFVMIRRGPQRREVVVVLHAFDRLLVAERPE